MSWRSTSDFPGSSHSKVCTLLLLVKRPRSFARLMYSISSRPYNLLRIYSHCISVHVFRPCGSGDPVPCGFVSQSSRRLTGLRPINLDKNAIAIRGDFEQTHQGEDAASNHSFARSKGPIGLPSSPCRTPVTFASAPAILPLHF